MTRPPDGILLLRKQPDMTSFDCIRRLKKIWGRTDLGHGGTLDRFASGVLPILAGEGLKLARFFLESYPQLPTYWKTYAGDFEFGRATETGDPEGEIIATSPTQDLNVERVQTAMTTFVGTAYEQLPPRYSAKKIGGERASDLVRAGHEPVLKAVPVTLKSFHCTSVAGNIVSFETTCSKGTYVRSLALDLAKRLDMVAYVKRLERTAVGNFTLERTVTLDEVERMPPHEAILDLEAASSFLPRFALLPGDLENLRVGKTELLGARLANSGLAPNVYCMSATSGAVALYELGQDGHAKFLRSFASALSRLG